MYIIVYKIMTHTCNFCTKTLSSASNLSKHKKTNKQCLEIQAKLNGEETPDTEKLICDFCDKTYINKFSFKRHVCKITKERVIKLLNKINMLEEFVNKLERIIEKHQPTIINNNTKINSNSNNKSINNIEKITNMLVPLSLDSKQIEQTVNNQYKIDHYEKGIDGVVEFISDQCVDEKKNPIYYPIDVARRKFVYKNENNKIKTDFNGSIILDSYIPPVKKKNKEFSKTIKIKNDSKKDEIERKQDDAEHQKSLLEDLIEDYKKHKKEREKMCKEYEKKQENNKINQRNKKILRKERQREKRIIEREQLIEEGEYFEYDEYYDRDCMMDYSFISDDEDEHKEINDFTRKLTIQLILSNNNKFKIFTENQKSEVERLMAECDQVISECESENDKIDKDNKQIKKSEHINEQLNDSSTISGKLAKSLVNKIDIELE
jgi:hypothetical protein